LLLEARLRALLSLLALISGIAFPQAAMAAELSPAGRWVSIDDKDGRPRSVIEIADVAGALQARVVQIYDRPGDNSGHLCKKCGGDLKNKPVLGMTIMNGLKRDGDVWDGGTILDPDSGNVYSAKLHLVDGGDKLEVRGYLGISLFGRSQTWVREAAR
jgi:uncharacterized protein (DUF2147 family)